MNWLQRAKHGYRAPGIEHQYHCPDFVIWYTNRWLACGPRVRKLRPPMQRVRWHKRRTVCNPFSSKVPF